MSDADEHPTGDADRPRNARIKHEDNEWDRGARTRNFYAEYLEESKSNPLAQHGEGSMKKVLKPDDMPWEDSPQGRLKHILNEKMCEEFDIPVRATDIYMQVIPPGSKSGRHRHISEELVFVLEGQGHDVHADPVAVIEDEYTWEFPEKSLQFDWIEEDLIYVPPNTLHQHFNRSDDEPARLLCCQSRIYTQIGRASCRERVYWEV